MSDDLSKQDEPTPDSPEKWHQYWVREFQVADPAIKKFHDQSKKIVAKFLDTRSEGDGSDGLHSSRLNIFHSNIVTLRSMLYGRIPKVECDRRFADAEDDPARVASEMLERMLNTDIQKAGEKYSNVVRSALDDRLIVGLGEMRMRYQFTEKDEKIINEWVEEEHVNWKDVMWSPCRTYPEMRWKAYRSYMTRDALVARFKEVGKTVALSSKGPMSDMDEKSGVDKTCQDQAEVWEIWCKEYRKVFWFVKGHDKILDEKDDPLELKDFWPGPAPLISNVTTSRYMPRADYTIAQDLYQSIDELETRINILIHAVKVVGVYDKTADGVQRMLTEACESDLIPVENWAAFSEKGGIKGVVDWMPIEAIVEAIGELTAKQDQKIAQLYQLTGMSDIMRGQANESGVSATEQSLKAKFASIRIQALQDEFARFASDAQSIKAEIIARHFQVPSIIKQSNIALTFDGKNQPLVMAAVELIKHPDESQFRITVRPETLAMTDYAQLKQDRTEYIMALSQFMQSSAPLIEQDEAALPFLLKLLKWGMAGFKGSNEIEGVIDQTVDQLSKAPPKQEKPDPGIAIEQMKQQGAMQLAQLKQQGEAHLAQVKAQADAQLFQMQEGTRAQLETAKIQAENDKQSLKMQMDAQLEQLRTENEQALERMRIEAENARHEATLANQRMIADAANQTKVLIAQMQHEQAEKDREAAAETADADRKSEKETAEISAQAPLAADNAKQESKLIPMITQLVETLSRPKKVLRDEDGNITGVE